MSHDPNRDRAGAADRRRDDEFDGGVYGEAGTADADESWWERELASLALVVGLVLFLFPEPATSAIGIFLMGAGVVAWLVEWAR
ncbi:hypothetical protein [Halorussus marinus]|uniref:hypothetical protein n=1 Tax=Halorussus marinus TaxID=2505976 RepID=UPI00109191AA|nr:hypothetical protein [Halorussus marinus]